MARRTAPIADLTPTILAALRETPGLHSQVLALALNVDIEAVRAVLLRLEGEGRARREGATRGTRWFAAGSAPLSSAKAPTTQPTVPAAEAKVTPWRPTAPPAVTPEQRPGESRRSSPKTAVLDNLRDQIGTVPDSVLAKRAGTSTELVRQYRKKHGILGMQDRGIPRPPRVTESARPPAREAELAAEVPSVPSPLAASSPAAGSVWKVTVGEGQTRYVVGASIGEAAARAVARAGTSQIISIDWFADLWE